ncbi:hypothetical protein Ctha_2537 [Chloroherpeton thalassium ATCC 35110]|uniref:Soluble ligand binding domain-containing protein n=1 Tax=Chloroherpeton thalassium (strain ATCC 35110 / GB-78) TaxID=517418 RepID=B3QXS1_CHLT3|nr:hypothetical protein [Chloroherpeton thalassium]ACF14986.1 hypothetical protein Ctha_2537 [Chloroherpeton thalassium ATCC 35110]
MKKVCTTIFVLLILALDSNLALSQVFGGTRSGTPSTNSSNIEAASPSAYYYGRGEGVLIDVNLWGQVGKPGKYFVPYTTDLISLISIAGGPTNQAKLDEVRIVRYAQRDTTVVEKIARVNIIRFIEYGEQSHIPPLVRGDTVIVPGDALSVFQTFVSIASSISVVINTFLLIAVINDRI